MNTYRVIDNTNSRELGTVEANTERGAKIKAARIYNTPSEWLSIHPGIPASEFADFDAPESTPVTFYELPAKPISAEAFDELASTDLIPGEVFRITDTSDDWGRESVVGLVREDRSVAFYESVMALMAAN